METHVREKIFDLFTRISVFKSYTPAEIKETFFNKGYAKIIEYDPAETIIDEGKYDNWVFWLIDGKIEVVKNTCRVATFERVGDMFGEMGILEGDARSASVYACTKAVCLAIDMSILDHAGLAHAVSRDEFCRSVVNVTKDRLAKTTTRMSEVERQLQTSEQRRAEAEQKYHETLQTLKKTLQMLDEKDRELADMRRQLEQKGR